MLKPISSSIGPSSKNTPCASYFSISPTSNCSRLFSSKTVREASGSKKYRIVADGYPEDIITVDVKTGTKTIQKISLNPLISEAAKAEIDATASPIELPASPEVA